MEESVERKFERLGEDGQLRVELKMLREENEILKEKNYRNDILFWELAVAFTILFSAFVIMAVLVTKKLS